jgi:hypothetical protein
MQLALILVRWLHLSASILLASLLLFEAAIFVPAARKPSLQLSRDGHSMPSTFSSSSSSLRILLKSSTRLVRHSNGRRMGRWASLTMETIPPKTRGIISGVLQVGYPSGYLLAPPTISSVGVECSWSAPYRRCSCSSSAAMWRNRRRGNSEAVGSFK